MSEYFYEHETQKIGPVTLEVLQALAFSGGISRNTLIYNLGSVVPAKNVPGLTFHSRRWRFTPILIVCLVLTAVLFGYHHISRMRTERSVEDYVQGLLDELSKGQLAVQERAYNLSISLVSMELKAPATARFSSMETANISISSLQWDVSGTVDAHNAYGALVRQYFRCIIPLGADGNPVPDKIEVILL